MGYKTNSPLPIAEGGTNSTSLTNTDGVAYFDGTKIATTAVGTATHVLTSNGTGVAPTFQAAGGGGVGTFDSIDLPTTTATDGLINVNSILFMHNKGGTSTFLGPDSGNLSGGAGTSVGIGFMR